MVLSGASYRIQDGRQGVSVTDRIVTLKLNQQQLELIDRTLSRGLAADRAALVRLALREYAAKRDAAAGTAK